MLYAKCGWCVRTSNCQLVVQKLLFCYRNVKKYFIDEKEPKFILRHKGYCFHIFFHLEIQSVSHMDAFSSQDQEAQSTCFFIIIIAGLTGMPWTVVEFHISIMENVL